MNQLAIIVPFYKIDFFKQLLNSINSQTNKKFNVYVGNDCSSDDPTFIIDQFQELNIKYKFFDANLGGESLTQQWERCIELANSEEWFMILGDDDVLGENVVEEFYQLLSKKINTNLIRFSSQLINEQDKAISKIYEQPEIELASSFYGRKVQFLTRSSLSEHIIKKSGYEKYKFYNYPLAWCSDDRLFLDVSENLPIYSINSAVVYIRMSTVNISGKSDFNSIKGKTQIKFYKYVLDFYSKNLDYKSTVALINIYEYTWFDVFPNRNAENFFYLLFKYMGTRSSKELFQFMIRTLARIKIPIFN